MRTTLVLASLILLVGCQKAPKTAALAPTYDSAAVETRKIEVTVDASGVVEPECSDKSRHQARRLAECGKTYDLSFVTKRLESQKSGHVAVKVAGRCANCICHI